MRGKNGQIGAASGGEDVDGGPGGRSAGQEAGDDDAGAAVDGDGFVVDGLAVKVAADVLDGVAEAAAGDVEVGADATGSRREGYAVDGVGEGWVRGDERRERRGE